MEQHHDKIFGQCYVSVKQKWRSPYPSLYVLTCKICTLAKLIYCIHRDVESNASSVNLSNSSLCALPHSVKARGGTHRREQPEPLFHSLVVVSEYKVVNPCLSFILFPQLIFVLP